MSERLTHPPEEALLRFADAELPVREADPIRQHLGTCPECRTRLDEIEEALVDHARLHQREKASFPPPPRPWDDIAARIAETEAALAPRPRRVFGMPPRAWLATAAVLLVCVAVERRFHQAPPVSAAELLEKASAAAAASPARSGRRIQVKSRRQTLVRPASVRLAPRDDAERELRALFAAAGYSWENPLSADAFATWRGRLKEKRDKVTVTTAPALYLIRTSTPEGELAAATLSLRSADLHPVRETLEFRNNESVEISELPDAPPLPVAAAPTLPPRVLPEPAPAPGPAQELHVVAALNRIGADLGEPIELSRRPSGLVVSGTGIGPRRQEEVRASVAGLPGVEVHFDELRETAPPRVSSAPVAPPARRTAAAEQELAERLGHDISVEEFTNRVLDASDAVMARAHALRALAARFPPEVEARLGSSDRELLAALGSGHLAALDPAVGQLVDALVPLMPAVEPAAAQAIAAPHWQARAHALLEAARHVDRLLNTMLAASGGDHTAELRSAIARLRAELEAAR